MEYPDYFQMTDSESLRDQVKWLLFEVGISKTFFIKTLSISHVGFDLWLASRRDLDRNKELVLIRLWDLVLHLFSRSNCDIEKFSDALSQELQTNEMDVIPSLTPPWSGCSIQDYIANNGEVGIDKITRWLALIRYGNPYSYKPVPPI